MHRDHGYHLLHYNRRSDATSRARRQAKARITCVKVGSHYYAKALVASGRSAIDRKGHHSAIDAIRAGIRLWT